MSGNWHLVKMIFATDAVPDEKMIIIYDNQAFHGTKTSGYQNRTIASKINVTPKGVRLSEKLLLFAALCNEI